MNSDLLAYQAKSFYNAYINLEQIHFQADNLLFAIPMLVNGAFSVELSLKTILAKNNIDYKKEHNLLSLFEILPEKFQCEIMGYLFKKAPEYKDAEKFSEELILVSNAFVDWRYAFEGKSVPAFDLRFLSALANASICTVLAHYNIDLVTMNNNESDAQIEEKIESNRRKCIETNIKHIQKNRKGKQL